MQVNMDIMEGDVISPDAWSDFIDDLSPDTVNIAGHDPLSYPDIALLLKMLDKDGRRIILTTRSGQLRKWYDVVSKHCDVVYITTTDARIDTDMISELKERDVDVRICFHILPTNISDMISVYTMGYPVLYKHVRTDAPIDVDLLYKCVMMCKTASFMPEIRSLADIRDYYAGKSFPDEYQGKTA